MSIAEGSPAPDFSLDSTSGKKVSLKDLRGKPVVLYFYPKDDTPGCTAEACAFRDRHADFGGAVLLGVSPDDLASHGKFRAKFHLPFDLLADPDHATAEAYEVWKEKSMYGKKYMGIERSTFVIDKHGNIARAFRNVKVPNHDEDVIAAVKALTQ